MNIINHHCYSVASTPFFDHISEREATHLAPDSTHNIGLASNEMAVLSHTLLTLSALAIFSTLPVLAHPSQHPDSLSKRAGTAGSIISTFLGNEIKGPIFGSPPECCPNGGCTVRADDTGKWQACWDAPPQGGGYYWTQDDTKTANCLINLHWIQSDACISVVGSECEAGKGTSQILNAWMAEAYSLSFDDSNTLQTASNNMVGETVSSGYADNNGLSMGAVGLTRVGQNSAAAQLEIRFDGDQGC